MLKKLNDAMDEIIKKGDIVSSQKNEILDNMLKMYKEEKQAIKKEGKKAKNLKDRLVSIRTAERLFEKNGIEY